MLSSEWDCIGLQTFQGFVVEIICFPLADKHLGGDGVPRLELQITLGQKVTVVGVVNRLDAAFHVGNLGIVLLLCILDVLLQCHDFETVPSILLWSGDTVLSILLMPLPFMPSAC